MRIRSKIYAGIGILWIIPIIICFSLLDLVTLSTTLKYSLTILLAICFLGWCGAVITGFVDHIWNQPPTDSSSTSVNGMSTSTSPPSNASYDESSRISGHRDFLDYQHDYKYSGSRKSKGY